MRYVTAQTADQDQSRFKVRRSTGRRLHHNFTSAFQISARVCCLFTLNYKTLFRSPISPMVKCSQCSEFMSTKLFMLKFFDNLEMYGEGVWKKKMCVDSETVWLFSEEKTNVHDESLSGRSTVISESISIFVKNRRLINSWGSLSS